jgi:hypothetical protein
MGKYNKFSQKEFKRPYDVHPIWRGIGCIMMILVPALSIIGAMVLIDEGINRGWPLPPEMLGFIQFDPLAYKIPVIGDFARTISSVPNLMGIIVFSIFILIVASGLGSFLYSALYRMFGPPRYTALDAPETRKARSYKR